jgi:hypothetical protein
MDGTFRSTPSDFFQLLTIHVLVFGKTFPAFYILLQNKKETSYSEAFSYINDVLRCKPICVITDFEKYLFNAANKCFLVDDFYFCHFYYCQSLYKRIVDLGFTKRYKTDTYFNEIIRKIFS